MTTRDTQLLAIRPIIKSIIISQNMSNEERFQNITLRPVIKLQNELFIQVFRNYIAKHKNVFYQLTIEKRLNYIENAVHKDIKFRNSIKGMIIGQFTTEEYEKYILNSSALNKRMMTIVKQRLQSNIQLFEKPEILKAV
ncbi:glyoxalase [Olleya sp. AS48]|uniref:glyoxalase n=1 Tax=Olleya sp. AS48 TaxID=3135774 RepID=UPI00317092FC